MHVLFIPSFYPHAENLIYGSFFQEQAQMLSRAGVKVGVIYPEIRPLKSMTLPLLGKNHFQIHTTIEKGIPTVRMHGWNLFPKLLRGTQWQWRQAASTLYKQYVQKFGKPTVIHAQSALWGGIAAHALAQEFSIPYILSEHRDNFLYEGLNLGSHNPWLDTLLTKAFRGATAVTTVSQFLKQGIVKYVDQVHVIPNFIDTENFIPQAKKDNGIFTFLTVGNLMESKNISVLLEAYALLRKTKDQVLLQVVGDGPERTALENKALRLGIPVQFKGTVLRDQILHTYAGADAFVLPSRLETFGIVFVEAMAMGLPSVAVRGGGPEEILEKGGGILIDQAEPALLKDAMLRLIETRGDYRCQSLHALAKERYGKETILKNWLELYSGI